MNIISGTKLHSFIVINLLGIVTLIPKDLLSQAHLEAELHYSNVQAMDHQADRWYFGQNAGLDFRGEDPVADMTNILLNVPTSPAVISDSLGNILFFTNGVKIWSSNYLIMENGDSLHGFIANTMPVLIVPKPGSDKIYYIFTTHRPNYSIEPTTVYGLEYNEVDLSQNGGMGAVTKKNKVLLQPEVSSKLTAIKKSNGVDYWVVAHKFNSNEFCSFSVTSDGVDVTGYVSSVIGTVHSGPGETNNGIGYMKLSPDGTKLALAIYGSDIYEIFDFNASSGKLTNVITSPPIFKDAYGIEFSSDSRYLYATTTSSSLPQPNFTPPSYIFQFDVTRGIAIFTNYDTVAVDTLGSYFGGIQLGTDGRIYISRSPYGNDALAVIENPKRPGNACNFADAAIYLQGQKSRFGLPNFIQTFFNHPHFDAKNLEYTDTTYFSIQNHSNIDNISWDFGDANSGSNTSTSIQPTHVYSGPGTYMVHVTEYFNGIAYGPYSELVTITYNAIINEGNENEQICRLYPNPGNGILHLLFLTDIQQAGISVSNSQGQVVWGPGTYHNLKTRDEVVINLNDIPEGLLFIEINVEDLNSYSFKYLLRK